MAPGATLERPLVINLAMTGMVPRRADNPHLPITPSQIGEDAERCARAGATVFHLHARLADEEPTFDREVFSAVVEEVRRRVPAAIVCVTTSGRVHKSFEERSAALDLDGPLRPDLASLTLGSMNFPKQASVNDPAMIERLAARMQERGIVPELEIFDFGMLDYAQYLIERGTLKPPFVCNLLLGSLGTLSATALNLASLVERLPLGAFWAVAGIGRFQLPMNALGVVMGGHVRTGLEDNLYLDLDKREPASNLALVTRVARVAESVGRPIASPGQARAALGLPPRPA
jgi:3-keto-5-aminohexanoate cleavage enzyme